MGDLLFVAIVVAFFAVTVLFVKACDSIIGPDPEPITDESTRSAEVPSDADRRVGATR